MATPTFPIDEEQCVTREEVADAVSPKYLATALSEQQPLLHVSHSSSTLTSSSEASQTRRGTENAAYGTTTPPIDSIWLLKQEASTQFGGDDDREDNARKKKRKPWYATIDMEAFQFALRMAILLTVSALFVLCGDANDKYPSGMWVLVSVLFVSWFPSLGKYHYVASNTRD